MFYGPLYRHLDTVSICDWEFFYFFSSTRTRCDGKTDFSSVIPVSIRMPYTYEWNEVKIDTFKFVWFDCTEKQKEFRSADNFFNHFGFCSSNLHASTAIILPGMGPNILELVSMHLSNSKRQYMFSIWNCTICDALIASRYCSSSR